MDISRWVNPKTGTEVPLSSNVVRQREFNASSAPLTVGLELELMVRDAGTMDPAGPKVLEVFAHPHFADDGGGAHLITHELPVDMVEVKTNPQATVGGAVQDLVRSLAVLADYFGERGMAILPISLEPLRHTANVNWGHEFIKRLSYVKHGVGTSRIGGIGSLQVNIAVGEGNALLFVHKALRRAVPLLVALTANSPFHAGRNTHMLAMRPNMRATLLDSGWVAEDIAETEWVSYLERRAKMCQIGVTMVVPWAHNLPLRIRPDRDMCIEIAAMDIVPDPLAIGAVTDFLRRLVYRILVAYEKCERLPASLGASDQLAIQKNMQEAVIRGRNGSFLDGCLNVVPTSEALRSLIRWTSEATIEDDTWSFDASLPLLYDALVKGAPAEELIAEFSALHDCPTPDDGCVECETAIRTVCGNAARRFSHIVSDMRAEKRFTLEASA